MTGREFLEDAAHLIDQYRASIAADLEGIPEERMWERPVPGMVSPANLVLHVTGNLRHFFGHLLGASDYVRDRDREFAITSGMSRREIVEAWDAGAREAAAALLRFPESQLDAPAPVSKYPGDASTHHFVARILAHLSYHAGQIRMLRRMLGTV